MFDFKVFGSAMLFALVLALSLNFSAAVNEDVYEPGSRVNQYHTFDFEISQSYGKKVATRAVPFILLGVLFSLIFLLWGCFRCCCCKRQETTSDSWMIAYTMVGLLLTATCVGILFYGFHADKEQSRFFEQVPALIDNIIAWKDDTFAFINDIINTVFGMVNLLEDIKTADPGEAVISHTDIDNIINTVNELKYSLNNMTAAVNNTQLESLRSEVSENITNVDDQRHQIVIAILVLLLIFVVIRVLLMLLDVYGPVGCKPSKNKFCAVFSSVWTLAFLIVFLLVWLMSGFLLGLSIFFADFCVDPGHNIVVAGDIAPNDTAAYFLTCHMPSVNTSNPLTGNMDSVYTALNSSRSEIITLNGTLPANCHLSTECVAIVNITTLLIASIDDIETSFGLDENNDGNYETGLFGQLSCAKLNGKVQAFFHVLCGDFFDALSTFFETMTAFCVIMTLVEFVRRRHPSKKNPEKQDPELPPQKPGYLADGNIRRSEINNHQIFNQSKSRYEFDSVQLQGYEMEVNNQPSKKRENVGYIQPPRYSEQRY